MSKEEKNNDQILGEKFKVIMEIGKGAFGKVYKVVDINNPNKFFAVKRLNKEDINKSDYLIKAYYRELEVMYACNSENSVILYEQFQSTNNYNIVMELCDGDLDIWNNNYKGFINEDQLKEILLGLNNVFKIMNEKNIVHRDLKLKNIMITYLKSFPNEERQNLSLKYKNIDFVPKLSDFGFSKMMDDSDITKTKLGTPATMAPEVLNNQDYTKKCDIWSLGVIMFQLLYKQLPFRAKNEMEIKNLIFSGKGFKIPEGHTISETLMDLLKKMLTVDVRKRISWDEYFKHLFFKTNECEKELERFEKTYGSMRKLSEDNQGIYNIMKAKNKQTGELVFIKEIDRNLIDKDEKNKALFDEEIRLYKELSQHKDNFIQLIDIFKTNSMYLIVTEYFEGQLLESYLNKKKKITNDMILRIINQITVGMEILNGRKIILPSLTPKSFCFKYFKDTDNFQLKFFDLGLSKIFNDSYFEKSFNLDQPINEKTNVLSYGLIMYKIVIGNNLFNFNQEENIHETIKKSKLHK